MVQSCIYHPIQGYNQYSVIVSSQGENLANQCYIFKCFFKISINVLIKLCFFEDFCVIIDY